MATDKKMTAKVDAPKAAVVKKAAADTKAAAAPVQAAEPAVKKAESVVKEADAVKAVEKKAAETKKAVEKKAADTKKAVEKKAADAKKTVTKKAASVKSTVTKKAELKSDLHIQFSGKSYAQEELMKMAKDVWKYDLKQKAGDLASIELYVKPEENIVYYVMNKEFTGSFYI